MVLAALSLLTATLACRGNENSPKQWVPIESSLGHSREDTSEFVTTNLAAAQAEVPFPIILPTCIPGEARLLPPSYRGTFRSSAQAGAPVQVGISYLGQIRGDDAVILISELQPVTEGVYETQTSLGDSIPDAGAVNIDILGTVVTESPDSSIVGDLSRMGAGYEYWWEKGGRSYSVILYSFTRDEALGIVESMITQQ